MREIKNREVPNGESSVTGALKALEKSQIGKSRGGEVWGLGGKRSYETYRVKKGGKNK